MESLYADLKQAWKQIRLFPLSSLFAIVVVAISLGIGSLLASLALAIVFKSLPVPQPNRLIEYTMQSGDSILGLSGPEVDVLQRTQKTSDLVAVWSNDDVVIGQGSSVRKESAQFVSPSIFSVLQLQPVIGTTNLGLTNSLAGNNQFAVVVSYEFWRQYFLGQADVIGAVVDVDAIPLTVIGVLPPEFHGLTDSLKPNLFIPIAVLDVMHGPGYRRSPARLNEYVVGRLRSGMSLRDAGIEARSIYPAIRKQADPSGIFLGQLFKEYSLVASSGSGGVSRGKLIYSGPLQIIAGLLALMLLLCCVNTGLLMLARATTHLRDYAIRVILGSSRAAVIRVMFLEALILVGSGAIAGWVLARLVLGRVFRSLTDSTLDPESLRSSLFIFLVYLLCTLAVALSTAFLPAIVVMKNATVGALSREGSNATTKLYGGLMISLQVALGLILVSASLYLTSSLRLLTQADLGFDVPGVALGKMTFDKGLTPQQSITASSALLQNIQTQPGVMAAGLTSLPPLSGAFGTARMFARDSRGIVHVAPDVFAVEVSPSYFDAAGTKVDSGEIDSRNANKICAISLSASRYFFPDSRAIGQILYDGSPEEAESEPSCTVAAIVQDAHFASARKPVSMMVYRIRANGGESPLSYLIVRGHTDDLAAAAIRSASKQNLPPQAEVKIDALPELLRHDLNADYLLSEVANSFSALAMFLASLCLYGQLMQDVTRRSRELAIRMALGADHLQVLRAIVVPLAKNVMIGIALGLVGSFVAIFMIRHFLVLPDVTPARNVLLAVCIMCFFTLISFAYPARRSITTDPAEALRLEG
jgi:predicted permease